MESIDHMVDNVLSHLSDAATGGVVTGDPIKLGDVTVVILSMVSVGMGAAGGEGSGQPTNKRKSSPGGGFGEGAGGGAKVRPAAVLAFSADGVQVLTIPNEPGVFDKMVERVPEVIEMVERARHADA